MKSTTRAKLAQAFAFGQSGRLPEAVAIYREVLDAEPRNGDALHQFGIALARAGRARDALGLLRAAAEIQPASAEIQVNLGHALVALGQLVESLAHFERAIALKADFGAAYSARGIALMRLERFDEALANLGQAVRLGPDNAAAHSDLGVALERVNRLQDALYCFERAIALDATLTNAHHNRGLIEMTLGRPADALASIERALALEPQHAALHSNRGHALLALARAADALDSYNAALAIQPGHADTHHARGLALLHLARHTEALADFDRALALGSVTPQALVSRSRACLELNRAADALASLERALALNPQHYEAQMFRGTALSQLRRNEEALASFDKAITLNPNSAEAFNNRGAVRVRLSRPAEGLADFVQAILLNPDYAAAYINAGNTQRGLARYAEASQSFDRALSIAAQDPRAKWGKALLKLSLGEFRDGWPLYESRFQLEQNRPLLRNFGVPRWSGAESLEGKTLLVYADQGLGDTLQFCRYLPALEARGARLILEVQPVLKKLLCSLDIKGTLLGRGEPVPPCDFSLPLVSLPLAFRTELHSIPDGVPYLTVDSDAARSWAERLALLPGFKVGLNWQGNVEAERDAGMQARSFPLAAAAPLARVPGISLVSLQKGMGAEQRNRVEYGERIAQLTDPNYMGPDEIADETAAIIVGLDLVITSDTALAHLAGALGVPVWVVLQAVPDWRWLTERTDSPWYPTMRLFRQQTDGDWADVFERVATDLNATRA